jgi:predicted house-cleaning noncanonical NTP pyrophosphatase (MazG superfamily)
MEGQQTVFKQYRFDFSTEVKENLKKFSQNNANLSRKEFKNAWTQWLGAHTLLQHECESIINRGFKGDPVEKMYHSVRYYHRKPESNTKVKSINKKPQEPRTYIRLTDDLHAIMDKHIRDTIIKIINNPVQFQTTHTEAFTDFLKTHRNVILAELIDIKNRDNGLEENMDQKLRKRYRDKYYKERLVMSKIIQV